METSLIQSLGDELHRALTTRRTIVPISERGLDVQLADAYAIQERMLSHRLHAGASVIGKKVGATSQAVQQRLGVFQPDFGRLLSDMRVADGETVSMSRLIQPMAEGEIAFSLKSDLQGPGLTAADVLRATAAVMPCFEIVDSRITDWKIKIADTVADNASAALFVVGADAVDPRRVDLALTGMLLEKDGQIAATGAGAAALGHPVNAVLWLANALGALGVGLRAGEIILSGALGPLVQIQAGTDLRLTLGGIGQCAVRFTD